MMFAGPQCYQESEKKLIKFARKLILRKVQDMSYLEWKIVRRWQKSLLHLWFTHFDD